MKTTEPNRNTEDISKAFDPALVLADPVGYLATFGIEAELVEQPILSAAA